MIGTTLGHFRIVGRIGAGGMGEVYRARDEVLHRDVALKVLPAELADEPGRRARFEQEARAVARLSHPNIVAVHEFGEKRGITFVVTELLEGETVRDIVRRGPVPWRRAVEIAAAIADGLGAAHAAGVIHRDLKPENLFVTGEGRVKILDFGLARIEPLAARDVGGSQAPTATMPGTVLGTVGYMAPEQVRGEEADARADVFALGCVLYELLEGRRAFGGKTVADAMAAILRGSASPLATDVGKIPEELARIVDRCLEKNTAARFQSAADLGFALRGLLSGPRGAETASLAPVSPRDTRPSVAVLPFANLSADQEQEYFCDGMAEEIINALAHLEGMRVIARTSSFAFKGASGDVREIGGKLDVRTVLEGSVRKSGNRLRITAQLIDVADGSHLWSERFDRMLEDVFAIQDEIALAIVENLKVRLLGADRESLVKRPTANLRAYNAYLMGVYFWNKVSAEGYARSRECLEEAISVDPNFAPGYAYLAVWYGSQAFWGTLAPSEVRPRVTPLIEKALALDATIPEPHALLGVVQGFIERDWVAGERSLRHAVELAPNNASAWTNLAVLLLVRGSRSEAVEAARCAQRLDPLSPTLMTWTASWLASAGLVEEALIELGRQKQMHPEHWLPHHFLGEVLARQGRLNDARTELERAVEKSAGAPVSLGLLACVRYREGDRRAGDELVQRLQERAGAVYAPPMFLAWAYLAQGDGDAALVRAREAVAGNDPWIAFHRFIVPDLAPADPRVEELLAPVLP